MQFSEPTQTPVDFEGTELGSAWQPFYVRALYEALRDGSWQPDECSQHLPSVSIKRSWKLEEKTQFPSYTLINRQKDLLPTSGSQLEMQAVTSLVIHWWSGGAWRTRQRWLQLHTVLWQCVTSALARTNQSAGIAAETK